jgi:hypothetical protein
MAFHTPFVLEKLYIGDSERRLTIEVIAVLQNNFYSFSLPSVAVRNFVAI